MDTPRCGWDPPPGGVRWVVARQSAVHAELRAQGVRTSKKRVARRIQQEHLVTRKRRRSQKTTDSGHTLPVAPRLVVRQSAVGRRHHLPADEAGLPVPGNAAGAVLARRGRICAGSAAGSEPMQAYSLTISWERSGPSGWIMHKAERSCAVHPPATVRCAAKGE